MPKIQGKYESFMVLNTKLSEEETKALIEKFSAMISANGTLENVDEWGKRKLAYEIEDETEGYYVLFTFTSDVNFPVELQRVYNITDGILRSLVVCKD